MIWPVLAGLSGAAWAASGFQAAADTAELFDAAYRFLPEVEIRAEGLTPEELREYHLTVYRVRKVYPYARMAGERFRLYEDSLARLPRSRDRKAFLRAAEADIRRNFLSDLKNLTVSQGKILFKLISRQTGHSSYALLKEFKSGFSAFTYQVVGSTFGYNLKQDYDPMGEDRLIESIVQQIESGRLGEIPLPTAPAATPDKKGGAKRKKAVETPPKKRKAAPKPSAAAGGDGPLTQEKETP